MDTSDPDIQFDNQGVCHHCAQYQRRRLQELPEPDNARKILSALVEQMKHEGKGKDYDCIIGLSGGVDSSYVAYQVSKLGLRALAVHLDNAWNSELAVGNIEKIVNKLGIDLYSHVLPWEEFRGLQRAFFQASVPNCEMPTDHAILAVLFDTAAKQGVRFILSGSNLASEGITLPPAWGRDYRDWTHLKSIHRLFGKTPLNTFPRLPFLKLMYRVFVNRIRFIPILNYMPYVKTQAIEVLRSELGWAEYGRKHGESLYTRYFQEHYLPVKFGYDKRRLHYSVLINSGQMTRAEALNKLDAPMFSSEELEQLTTFFLKKLMVSREEWSKIMSQPCRSHLDYPTNWCFTMRESAAAQLVRRLATGRSKVDRAPLPSASRNILVETHSTPPLRPNEIRKLK